MPRPAYAPALAALSALAFGLGSSADAATDALAGSPESRAERTIKLDDFERAALAHQPQVTVARAATRIAEGQAEQARSPLLPQVTGTAAYTRETGNFVVRPGVFSPGTAGGWNLGRSFDYWNFGVSAGQLIFDFGQTFDRYKSARSTVDAQRFQEQATRLQVIYGVRRTYFNARAMMELVLVARETVDAQDKHLTQVQGYVSVGTQAPIALATQRAAVANARVQLITAQNNYETAKAQLNQAAGLVGGTDYDVGNEELAPVDDEDQSLEVLVDRALGARPELAILNKQIEAQAHSLSSAKAAYGPSLAAAAGATEQGTALDNLVPNWNAGLVATWAVFQGGLTTGQVHQAQAQLDSIGAQRSVEELQVRLEVDAARLAVGAAKATIGAAQDAQTNAREQLRLAEQRFATGVGNIIELTDAQVSYTLAAAQLVQARYGLSAARAQLLAALGRT